MICFRAAVDFPDEPSEVPILIERLYPVARRRYPIGRVLPNSRPVAARVNSVGFTLSDKEEGPFLLDVDWIKFYRPIKKRLPSP